MSFIKLSYAKQHNIPIEPNNQLALLADDKTRMASLGEINIELIRGPIKAKLRALVMDNLQADCFGGTTFHYDNDIQARIKSRQIKLHNKYVLQQTNEQLPLPNQTTSSPSARQMTIKPSKSKPPSHSFLSFDQNQLILPSESVSIPYNDKQLPSEDYVTLQPLIDSKVWTPQICPVQAKSVVYTNNTDKPLLTDKSTRFLCLPATLIPPDTPTTPYTSHPTSTHSNKKHILQAIANNTYADLLNPEQVKHLDRIHTQYIAVFNSDLSKGYNGFAGKFNATLNFKGDQLPESKICPIPLYNHKCATLQQQLMDRLEEQGVIVDPQQHNVQVRKLSPSFILQKGRAKHKKLEDCTLDELRWVVGFNSLNDDLLPRPSKPTSSKNILTFLAKHKFHIHADLFNSYFQIPVRKKDWQWLGIRTPFKGIRVLTRSGQGLLNSESELDELIARVLGTELAEGICYAERDDVIIGGESVEATISNWEKVLSKLASNNLKLSPSKVKLFPRDMEVFGLRIKDGLVLPSDHIIKSLGKSSIDQLKTVKHMNSWKGLYKTLLSSLPHLASVMDPFDKACVGKNSKDLITWSPALMAAFNEAMHHLVNITKLTLPRPDEQLILMPDGARVPGGIGWALFVQRITDGKPSLIPVQFYSAKIKDYMMKWLPCEIEGVASAMAINACSHWILASTKPTYVTPDCKAVVEAVERMKQGKLSRNPRLQMILISINRRPVTFIHSSAKTGQHAIPDYASRLDITCGSDNCAVERFLNEIPDNVQCMPINALADIFQDTDACITAASSTDLINTLANSDNLPLGNLGMWKQIQASDPDISKTHELLSTGDSPRKNTSKLIKTIFRHASLKDDLVVVRETDHALFKDFHRIVIPKSRVIPILTILHIKGNHPAKTQSEKIFARYFFCPGFKEKLNQFYDQCFTCQSIKKIPNTESHFRPPNPPNHPGTRMNADVIKRAKQLILVNIDLFSNYMTATLLNSEKAADLEQGLIQVITPLRAAQHVSVRVDSAPGLRSLAQNQSQVLKDLGIHLDVGEPWNKNSNCYVDKAIQELELEISKLVKHNEKISSYHLAHATKIINAKIRNSGFSAQEILFRREQETNQPVLVADKEIQINKKSLQMKNQKVHIKHDLVPDIAPGDIVFLKDNPVKHTTRDTLLVTNQTGENVTVQKILNLDNSRKCILSKRKHVLSTQRIFKSPTNILTTLPKHERTTSTSHQSSWNPTLPLGYLSSSDDSDIEVEETDQIPIITIPPRNISLETLPFLELSPNLTNIDEEEPTSPIEPYLLQRQIFERQLMLSRIKNKQEVYPSHLQAEAEAREAVISMSKSLSPLSKKPRQAKINAKKKLSVSLKVKTKKDKQYSTSITKQPYEVRSLALHQYDEPGINQYTSIRTRTKPSAGSAKKRRQSSTDQRILD